MPTLEEKLERVFPFARRIDVTVPAQDDGSFVAELALPVREGVSRVQLYRYPAQEELGMDGRLRFEARLSWPGPHQRLSFGHGDRWAFLASWDGVATKEELRELVSKRVARHPLLGTDDAA